MNEPVSANEPQPKISTTIEFDQQARRVRYSPCGRFLFAACHDARIRRWDVSGDNPVELPPLEGHHGWVETLAFGAGGEFLISADSWGGLVAWDYRSDPPTIRWQHSEAHDGWIRSATVRADGAQLVTAGRDRTVRVWSASNGDKLGELNGHEFEVYAAALHPAGTAAVSADLLGHLIHWNLSDGTIARQWHIEDMHYYDRIQDVAGIYGLAFEEDGATLRLWGAQPTKIQNVFGVPTLRLVDWESLQPKRTWQLGPEKDGFVYDVAQRQDGSYLLVTSGTPGAGKLQLLRPDADEAADVNAKLFNPHSVAVHPDGARFVVSTTNRNSQGNGAVRDDSGNYLGNTSPLQVFVWES